MSKTIDGPAIVFTRTFKAPVEKLWAMFTTREGLAKWYWPEPFGDAIIKHLDVRVGGAWEIAAEGLEHTSRGRYTEVVPCERLSYVTTIDFAPDSAPYERHDVVDFSSVPGGSQVVITQTRMHNAHWQDLANRGHASALEKLGRLLDV